MNTNPADLPQGPLVAWYGDDFTGSAAVMEALTFSGLPAVLFFDAPSAEQLEKFKGMRGIGIASTARAHSPEWMDEHLTEVFQSLKALNAPINHYKTCSTLDSSPTSGSIGRAIDHAMPVFNNRFVPIMIAAPAMSRYQAFGHLFASGPGGVTRLDRHPVMAKHPVTPMDESDVALHLSRQTKRPIGLLNLEALRDHATANDAFEHACIHDTQLYTLDCTDELTLEICGYLMWSKREKQQFVVGSQGIEYALVKHWQSTGMISRAPEPAGIGKAERMAVVSGSVSPVTAAQIDWSLNNGFEGIAFDTRSVLDESTQSATEERIVVQALTAIEHGRDPLIYTAKGPQDPAVAAMRQALAQSSLSSDEANVRIGTSLGRILDTLIRQAALRRAVISGGDTSGYASRQLGIHALTALAPTIPGAAIFRAHADGVHDGLELALKGGQMGSADYFGWVRNGGGPHQIDKSRSSNVPQ